MREATLIVIRKPHQGDDVIDNLVYYTVGSVFAEPEEILTNHIRNDYDLDHMIEDFYSAQAPYNMKEHRRMFHFILTTRASKEMCRILEESAYALQEYFATTGHQAVLVPHEGSKKNALNYHYHVIVNPISYITGMRMQDQFGTYEAIVDYLNHHTYASWCWKYHSDKGINVNNYY